MKRARKIWIWLFRGIGILVILCAVFSLSDVLHGGSVTETRGIYVSDYSPLRELYGTEGVLECLLRMVIGAAFLLATISPGKENSEDDSQDDSQSRTAYPYCRWWQDREGKWYSEENPLMVKEYPEDGVCPLCHKKIEKIDVGTR